WKGWPLFGLATLAGLVGIVGWATIDALLARFRGRRSSWALPAAAGISMLSAAAGFAATVMLLGIRLDAELIAGGISALVGAAPTGPGAIDPAPLPDVFRTVAELVWSDTESIAGPLGPVSLGLGLLGFALPFYLRDPRQIWRAAALGGGLIA